MTNGNGNRLRQTKKAAFIGAYRQTGFVWSACQKADINRSTYWRWTEHDAAFVAACREAEVEAGEQVET